MTLPLRRRLAELALRTLPPLVVALPRVALAQAAPPPAPLVVITPAPVAPPPVPPAPVPPPPVPPPPFPAEPAPPASAPAALVPPAATQLAGPPGERLDEARFTDTNSDHVILGLTAETNPKGTFYVSDYELVFPQLGYAITDSLQVSLTAFPPYVKDQPYFFDIGLKLNLYRGDVFRAAIGGGLDVLVDPSNNTTAVAIGGHVTGVAQFCFDGPCRSSVSLNLGTFLNNQSNDLLPIYGTAGLTLGVSKLVSLLVEPGFGSVLGSGSFAGDGGSVFFLDYGVRLSGEHFGFDLAFVRPFGTDVDGLIVGFPWVGFTYRTSGTPRTQPPAAVSMAMAR